MYKRSSTLPITHDLLLYLLFPDFYHLKHPNQFNDGFDKLYMSVNKTISINRNFFHSSFFLTILTGLVIKHIHQQLPTARHKDTRKEAQNGETPTLMTSIGKTLGLRCFTHWCTNLDLFMLFFIVFCFSIQFLKILCYTFLHVLTIITKKTS